MNTMNPDSLTDLWSVLHIGQTAPELDPSMVSWAVAFSFFISTALQHMYGEYVLFDKRKY